MLTLGQYSDSDASYSDDDAEGAQETTKKPIKSKQKRKATNTSLKTKKKKL